MQNVNENKKSVVALWEKANHVEQDSHLPLLNATDLIASFFSPGKYYYFILNFFDIRFEYIHPATEYILGIKPEDYNFELIFERMHPEDAAQIQLKESAAGVFFYERIPVSKIQSYKSSYTFRIRDANGIYKTILHQSIPLSITDAGRIHHVLSVHTDISFMNLLPDDRISFIGINGEPSYYSLSTDPKTILQPQKDLELSKREQEIVKLLSEGLASKQIADALRISTHTVDTHRRNLLKKTGAKNTLELAVTCLKKGLI